MRQILAAVPLVAFALAGCGQGSSFDKGFKDSYRAKFVANCESSARASMGANTPPQAMQIVTRVCGCTVDHAMVNKNAGELAKMDEKEMMGTAKQCMAEISPAAAAKMPG